MDQILPTTRPATASDVMTASVVSVGPETSVRDVAALLLRHRISAVPVVDGAGGLLGMVSEGDLLGRSAEDRLSGQEWWLSIMAKPGQLDATMTEAAVTRPVRDVMHIPTITVEADTPVRRVAEILQAQGIKRVPVMRSGLMVGIVSRADLLRVVEAMPESLGPTPIGGLADMIAGFFGSTGIAATLPSPTSRTLPNVAPVTADAFRHLVGAFDRSKVSEKKSLARAAELNRVRQVNTMLQEHVGTEMWDTLMTHARVAAAHGGKEIELLRFPSGLCTDGARKINNADPAWAETLRGEAAEMHTRWERELKPAGFGLAARVMDYPQVAPGDVALFLVWEN